MLCGDTLAILIKIQNNFLEHQNFTHPMETVVSRNFHTRRSAAFSHNGWDLYQEERLRNTSVKNRCSHHALLRRWQHTDGEASIEMPFHILFWGKHVHIHTINIQFHSSVCVRMICFQLSYWNGLTYYVAILEYWRILGLNLRVCFEIPFSMPVQLEIPVRWDIFLQLQAILVRTDSWSLESL